MNSHLVAFIEQNKLIEAYAQALLDIVADETDFLEIADGNMFLSIWIVIRATADQRARALARVLSERLIDKDLAELYNLYASTAPNPSKWIIGIDKYKDIANLRNNGQFLISESEPKKLLGLLIEVDTTDRAALRIV